MWSGREAVRLGAQQKIVKKRRRGGSSLASASEKSLVEREPGRRKRAKRGDEARYGEVEGDARTKSGCREQDIALGFAEKVEISSHSDSPGGTDGCETSGSGNVKAAVIEKASPTTWQEDVSTMSNKFTRAGLPN